MEGILEAIYEKGGLPGRILNSRGGSLFWRPDGDQPEDRRFKSSHGRSDCPLDYDQVPKTDVLGRFSVNEGNR